MDLTPEQQALGRRNFLKALAGTPALAALGGAAALKGPVRGGPVRLAWIGVGAQGRTLMSRLDPAFGEVRALCDINPSSLAKADEVLAQRGQAPPPHYTDWSEMLQKEDLEGVVVALPLWAHADAVVGCLEAGKHVLCEKMMAWDVDGCERMVEAAHKSGRVFEIGYQRFYNPVYQAAYRGVIRAGVLGEIYHARLAWHRNGNWRRQGEPPSPDYDASRWGYPSFEHLLNWRLYWRYSKGLFAELASHQVNVANWFFDAAPEVVVASGGVNRFKDGREVHDHVYAIFDYPGGRTATFTSVESNKFDGNHETFFGTKGTLILRSESEAYLFDEGESDKPTGIEVAAKGPGAVLESSESRPENSAAGAARAAGAGRIDKGDPSREELSRFCAAVRVRRPVECGPDLAIHSAKACILANEAIEQKTRLAI